MTRPESVSSVARASHCWLASVSYPIPRAEVDENPLDQDIYALWQRKTLAWLVAQFGEYLLSIVEHVDENYCHLHFLWCRRSARGCASTSTASTPGRYARVIALVEGADKKNGERSYRKGMRAWQDAFHRDVSAFFRHDRYGPRRARVSRRERELQLAMQAERARMLKDIEHKVALHEGRRRGSDRP